MEIRNKVKEQQNQRREKEIQKTKKGKGERIEDRKCGTKQQSNKQGKEKGIKKVETEGEKKEMRK